MIQFNLLPSVKLEYVRAKRNKRLTMLVAGLIGSVSLAILLILFFSVQVVQKKYSGDLSRDIKSQSQKLQDIADFNKILTIQNQLNTLPSLHDPKPVTSLLYTYLKQFTPANVKMATAEVNFDEAKMDFTGESDSISLINKFADTLKFTNYTVTYKEEKDKKACKYLEVSYDQQTRVQVCKAFTDVVLQSFGRDEKNARYSISMQFDPAIFGGIGNPTLSIPANKITTRSETEKPGDLFAPLTKPEQKQEQ